MKKAFEKIIENELLFKDLANKQFSVTENFTRENIKEKLSERSRQIRQVISEINSLIDEYIAPFLKNPEQFSHDQIMEFQKFAQALSGYKESIDTGLSYDIRNALIKYALHIKDEELYINNMFYKGLALFYLDSLLFKKEMSECYDAIIALSDNYANYSVETRNLIVRAYGNSYISVMHHNLTELFKRFDRAEDFWMNTAKKVDPDFPWDSYMINMQENLCGNVLTSLRNNDRYKITAYHKERLLEAAENIYRLHLENQELKTNDYTALQVRIIYFITAARYYNRLISNKEFFDRLYSIYKQAGSDYKYDTMYKKLQISGIFLLVTSIEPLLGISISDLNAKKDAINKDVFDYIKGFPTDLSGGHVSTLLANFAIGSHSSFKDNSYLKLLLSLTVFRHIPTYVHSLMVAKLSYTITEYLIKYRPEKLVGLPGIYNLGDVQTKQNEILTFVWYAGLVHDMGKIFYSHLVSFYARKLNDREFELIQHHSQKSEEVIKGDVSVFSSEPNLGSAHNAESMRFENNPDLFVCLGDVAFGHHKSFDGKFGYPKDFNNLTSPVKAVIDIITIADCIDAATDSVGRSYASEKTLKDMEEDMMSQIDTRYCPVVTSTVFECKALYDAIDSILHKYRYDVYYSCFSTSDLSDTMAPPTGKTF